MVRSSTDSPLEDTAATAQDFLSDLVTGSPIPAPVRKNLFKSISRICSAAIDVPVAHLEGRADEKRAETRARVQLVATTADQISQQMRVDPEYARRAVTQFGHRVLREQLNLDLIAEKSVKELKSRPGLDDTSEEDIDDDWLNEFETEARKKSTEEMQTYFARVLSGEVVRPGSFSIRALKILGSLDGRVAKLFQRLCSVSVEQRATQDMRVPALGRNAANNALSDYGLSFGHLNILNEYGLIIADYNSWRDYRICIGIPTPVEQAADRVIRLPFTHQGREWVLVPTPSRPPTRELKLHGVALTSSAAELSRIVAYEPTPDYTKGLKKFFRQQGLEMLEARHANFQGETLATAEA